VEQQKPRNTMLPLLVVLFVVSYGLLALLVVEQGRTIDSQRYLIHELFQDTARLTASKKAKPRQHAGATTQPQAQERSQKTPSTQEKIQEDTASQQKTEHKAGKVRKPLLEKPPKGDFDSGDERRSRYSI
jgi:hypothetical protein